MQFTGGVGCSHSVVKVEALVVVVVSCSRSCSCSYNLAWSSVV